MFLLKILNSSAITPKRATPGSAGLDLFACENDSVPPKKWKAISTGISIKIPNDCYARIAPRSGLAFKNGIDVFAGVVDSDYRAEIKVILMNHNDIEYKINQGDRIAQIIFEKIYTNDFIEVEELDETQRIGGFGSTGNYNFLLINFFKLFEADLLLVT